MTLRRYALAAGLALCVGFAVGEPLRYDYQLLDSEPHDSRSFTQGLVVDDQWIYESSGLYGRSKLMRYHKNNPQLRFESQLPEHFFAEGLTLYAGKLYLITWREGKALVYDKDKLRQLKSFNYEGEGWGLTHDGERFIMSDGSATLTFRSPSTFAATKTLTVHDGEQQYSDINELEYVDGIVWANQWRHHHLLGIDADTGEVRAVVDVTALYHRSADNLVEGVTNGIAYDADRDGFWITGKYWRERFLIRLIKPKGKGE